MTRTRTYNGMDWPAQRDQQTLRNIFGASIERVSLSRLAGPCGNVGHQRQVFRQVIFVVERFRPAFGQRSVELGPRQVALVRHARSGNFGFVLIW